MNEVKEANRLSEIIADPVKRRDFISQTTRRFINKATKQAIGLGFIAGIRTTIAPAVASDYLSKNPATNLSKSKLRFI